MNDWFFSIFESKQGSYHSDFLKEGIVFKNCVKIGKNAHDDYQKLVKIIRSNKEQGLWNGELMWKPKGCRTYQQVL